MLKKQCPYFTQCGACVWQNLTPEEYAQKKERFIRHAFSDAGIVDLPLQPMIQIPPATRRRACFALSSGHIGFNSAKSHHIVEITDCPLLKPNINKILPFLRTALKDTKLSGDIWVLETPVGTDIHIKSKQTALPDLSLLENLVSLNKVNEIVRVVFNNIPIFEKIALPFFADTFMQPSQEGEDTLVNLILSHLGSAKRIIDLFCGQGTFTRPLLKHGLTVIGYDSASDAVAVLNENGQVRDLFRNPLTSDEFKDVDLVILDPPRAGALAQVKELAQTSVKRIIMISCFPQTAARDSNILIQNRFHLKTVIPIDQFSYSNHIELFSFFEKE